MKKKQILGLFVCRLVPWTVGSALIRFTSSGAPVNPPPGTAYCVELRDLGEGVLPAQ